MATIKVIELVGSSATGWQEAAESALTEATKTLKGIKGIDVLGWTGKIEDGKIVEYHSNVKIAFEVSGEL